MPITDLTGYTWVANDETDLSDLVGLTYSVNFSSNNNLYTSINATSKSSLRTRNL